MDWQVGWGGFLGHSQTSLDVSWAQEIDYWGGLKGTWLNGWRWRLGILVTFLVSMTETACREIDST